MSKQSLLWSLQRPGGRPSWLFGTMHIRDERVYQLCNQLYPLVQSADEFIGEMDLDLEKVHGHVPIRYNIEHFLSQKEISKLKTQLEKSFSIQLDHYMELHPMMIMSIISTSVLQSEHLVSLDEHLWNYAKGLNKKTRGLESYEEQSQILYSIDPDPLYKQLMKISKKPSAIRKSTNKSLALYLKGDIHELYKHTKNSMQDLRKKVIYERNKHMVSVIDHLDTSTMYFITVGAGHLSGKFGLIRLLKRAGWQIKPVHRLIPLEVNSHLET